MRGWALFASAMLMLSAVAPASGGFNDACGDAESIAGEGIFDFDNVIATTDGPPHELCFSSQESQIARDVWYCWTSTCDGPVTVDTCGGTTADTRIAVYEGCSCPTTEATPLVCNDDACSYQSRGTFTAVGGNEYLIRIGNHPLLEGAAGTFRVACGEAPVPVCDLPADNCQDRDHWNALASDGSDYFVADDFTPAGDGVIDEMCWWGTYFDGQGDCFFDVSDAFEVTYYFDDGGVPGQVYAGPFSQEQGSLLVEGPARTDQSIMDVDQEYEYSASHEPVDVFAGQCYWIEIANPLQPGNGCTWLWEVSMAGNRRAVQDGRVGEAPDGYDRLDARGEDLAFCLNLPLDATSACHEVPINDACEDRIPIFEGVTFFDTSAATKPYLESLRERPMPRLPTPPPCEFPLGDTAAHKDIWYEFSPACPGVLNVDLCGNIFDSKVAVYEGLTCLPYASAIACSDDACGAALQRQAEVSVQVAPGTEYLIRVGSYGSIEASDCYVVHNSEGCDDPQCEALVCAEDPTCCDTQWDVGCPGYAGSLCLGHGGPGTVTVDVAVLSDSPPALRSYAQFIACFTGECGPSICDPPMYADICCEPYDGDGDGDIDLDDYRTYFQGWAGP